MDDQTKNIQTLSIEGSIEHKKHNQLDIKYLHQLFIRNPQLGCLASHYKVVLGCLIPLSRPQLYSLILAQPPDLSISSVIFRDLTCPPVSA